MGILDNHEQRVLAQKPLGSFDLTDEVAVVTGASGRLGRVWAQALREAGAMVICTDTDDALHGDSPFRHIEHFCADLSDPESVEHLAREVFALGPVTILVNNAGVDDRPRAGVMSGPRYDVAKAMLDVNLLGTYAMLNVFGARMAHQGKGSIINIASLYGVVSPDMRYYGDSGFQKHAMYGATKAGIISLTKYYAALYGPAGVRVNALAPGGVVNEADPLTGQNDSFREKYTARIPMDRMCQPDDLTGPLLFLASQASSFVNGQTLAIDGGFVCW